MKWRRRRVGILVKRRDFEVSCWGFCGGENEQWRRRKVSDSEGGEI